MNTITTEEAKEMYYKNLITKEKFDEIFDELLDEEYGPIKIGNLEYSTSKVLKEIDPVAYRTWKNDYADSLISDGYILEEFMDFDSYVEYLESRGYKVIEEQESNLSM